MIVPSKPEQETRKLCALVGVDPDEWITGTTPDYDGKPIRMAGYAWTFHLTRYLMPPPSNYDIH